ncbi:MAG: Hsp20/alpha crystallin family protein [Elusimicrobia bacterium]|nr:Hsp20/alpha crystallin family protein [Elusimicrobiota bacterium]
MRDGSNIYRHNKADMDLSDILEGFISRLLSSRYSGGLLSEGVRMPAIDIYEFDDMVRVRVELPGMDRKDIKISLEGDLLTVQGTVDVRPRQDAYYTERSHGSFYRIIPLPYRMESGRTSASYKNGLLTVKIYKEPGKKPESVYIKEE